MTNNSQISNGELFIKENIVAKDESGIPGQVSITDGYLIYNSNNAKIYSCTNFPISLHR
jgi:hypothetical protein